MKSKLLTIGFLFPIAVLASCSKQENVNLITNKTDLIVAINQATDGDTLYVGDIDFRVEPQLAKSVSRINLSKNITIKNGLKDKKATFTSGSFNIAGTKVNGENLNVVFEDIIFDGDIEGSKLTDYSWLYDDPEDIEPHMCQYAMLYRGNVSASYSGCKFANYMNENGGAIWALYGDYPSNDFILTTYGDNSSCKLDIDIKDCSFENNYSYYGGGAIYIEGYKENVDISIDNTSFINNNTSCMEYAQGGGACFFRDLSSSFSNCLFEKNNGSYSYGLTVKDCIDISGIPEEFVEDYIASINDQTSGGAICTKLGTCKLENTIIKNNTASLGGGIATYNSKLIADGCVFDNNEANCDLLENPKDSTGPWSMMGLGGAIYINSSDGTENSFINTSFVENTARNGYGSIYSFYNGPNDGGILIYPTVNVNFCSFLDNKEIIEYDKSLTEWSARPGNGYDIPYINYNGCLIKDELCVNYYGRYERPSIDNNYTYYTDSNHLTEDNVIISKDDNNRILINSKGSITTDIPNEFINTLPISNNINYKLGSNYSKSLYIAKEPTNYLPLIISLSVLALIICIAIPVVIIVIKKKKQPIVAKEANNTNEDINVMVEEIKNDYKLTNREKEVLALLLEGKKRTEIAGILFLSESAIKKYTASIYNKIGVHSKIELIMKYQDKNKE